MGTVIVALATGPLILQQVMRARAAVNEARISREQQAELARKQSKEQAEREQQLREDQARPFVFLDLAPAEAWAGIIELVISNTGRTIARDVRTPAFESAPGSSRPEASSVLARPAGRAPSRKEDAP